ncbi:MAG: hypothetical protein ACRCTY_05045, partial [Candidatus Adiutrix sp.]
MNNEPQRFSDNNENLGSRYQLFRGLIFICFFILAGRLWYLQVIKGDELKGKVESNRTEVVDLLPVRGLILDRDGTVLVDNRPRFDLCVQKSKVRDAEKLIAELARLTQRSEVDLMKRYRELPRLAFTSLPLLSGLSREELVAIEANRFRLEGVDIRVSSARLALYDVFASHLIGYLGEITQKQLDNQRKRFDDGLEARLLRGETREYAEMAMNREEKLHRSGDLVGQKGVEQSMEEHLQGRRGLLVREVNSQGRVIKEINSISPEHGY